MRQPIEERIFAQLTAVLAERDALAAEVRQLREALEQIARGPRYTTDPMHGPILFETPAEMARAALAGSGRAGDTAPLGERPSDGSPRPA